MTNSSAIKIESKITGYSVGSKSENTNDNPHTENTRDNITSQVGLELLNERMERPESVEGRTYKIKPPFQDNSFYIIVNHVTLNVGTELERKVPFEVFIQGGAAEHQQWVSWGTRLVTSVWRNGGDSRFVIDDMKETLDPQGRYSIGGGRYANSIVAHIGFVIEDHLYSIGFFQKEEMSDLQRNYLDTKRKEYESKTDSSETDKVSGYPESANLCRKCHTKAVIRMDGCDTCLECGESKCAG